MGTNENSDLVWGGASIARALNVSEPTAKRWLETGKLPATQVAGKWVASEALLRKAVLGALDDKRWP
jgi:hypothetical protein